MELCWEGFPSGQRDQTVNLTRKLRWFESTPLHQRADESLKVRIYKEIFASYAEECVERTARAPIISRGKGRVRVVVKAAKRKFRDIDQGIEHRKSLYPRVIT